MERDHKGFLQYVNRNIVNGTVIEKYSALNGEELVFPRGELCLKFCALSPPRPVGQFFNGQEARCPDNIRYAGLAAYDWRSVLADDSRPSSPVLSPAALRKSWEFFSTGQKQSRIAKSIDDLNNNYKSADRVCVCRSRRVTSRWRLFGVGEVSAISTTASNMCHSATDVAAATNQLHIIIRC